MRVSSSQRVEVAIEVIRKSPIETGYRARLNALNTILTAEPLSESQFLEIRRAFLAKDIKALPPHSFFEDFVSCCISVIAGGPFLSARKQAEEMKSQLLDKLDAVELNSLREFTAFMEVCKKRLEDERRLGIEKGFSSDPRYQESISWINAHLMSSVKGTFDELFEGLASSLKSIRLPVRNQLGCIFASEASTNFEAKHSFVLLQKLDEVSTSPGYIFSDRFRGQYILERAPSGSKIDLRAPLEEWGDLKDLPFDRFSAPYVARYLLDQRRIEDFKRLCVIQDVKGLSFVDFVFPNLYLKPLLIEQEIGMLENYEKKDEAVLTYSIEDTVKKSAGTNEDSVVKGAIRHLIRSQRPQFQRIENSHRYSCYLASEIEECVFNANYRVFHWSTHYYERALDNVQLLARQSPESLEGVDTEDLLSALDTLDGLDHLKSYANYPFLAILKDMVSYYFSSKAG
jgi:hypothetical protein